MKNQLQLSEVKDTLSRGKDYIGVFKEIMDLQEMCQNLKDSKLLEYVPVKIVACLEQFFRDEYREILYNPKTKGKIKDIDIFKNTKYDFDIIDAFEDNTITLVEYLSLLISCSNLEDIDNALSKMLNIDFLKEMKKRDGVRILKSINEIFRLRHIYCHEVPLREEISTSKALELISDSKLFLEHSDDIIRTALYSGMPSGKEEIEFAESEYKKADAELQDLADKIKVIQEHDPVHNSNFTFFEKWKEYREVRAKSESSIFHGKDYLPLYYYKSLERTTRTLIKELKEDYKYELKK